MKRPWTTLLIAILTLSTAVAYSQNRQAGKPSLFAGFPTTVNCTESQLHHLFTTSKGENIDISLDNKLTLSGTVTARLTKYSNLQTIIIKLNNFNNTLFSLSKQTEPHNSTIYVGKILNPLYADGFELIHNANGNYQLKKINVDKILVNCSQ